jgi:predicted DNA-binding transcriptional regulator AlpA
MDMELLKTQEYLSTGQVCKALGICRTTLYKWRAEPSRGFPEPMRFGRRNVFSSAMIMNYLVEQEKAAKKATREKSRLSA